MRVDLERVGRAVAARVQHPPLQHHVPEPPHHPALALELALDRRRHPLLGDRRRLVDGPPAALGELEREADVLPAAGVELDVGLAADGVDAAVARRDPGQPGLHRAHGHLVAPVEALLVAALAAAEADLAAGVADALVGEARRPGGAGRRGARSCWRPRRRRSSRAAPGGPPRSAPRPCRPGAGRAPGRRPPRARARRCGPGAVGGDHHLEPLAPGSRAPARSRPCARSPPPRRRRRRSGRPRQLRRRRAPAAGSPVAEQGGQRQQDGVADVRVDDQRHARARRGSRAPLQWIIGQQALVQGDRRARPISSHE